MTGPREPGPGSFCPGAEAGKGQLLPDGSRSGCQPGVITASYNAKTNTITVEPDAEVNGDFAGLIHPALVDVSRTVNVRTGNITRTVQVNPSGEFLEASMHETGDPELACVGKILCSRILRPED